MNEKRSLDFVWRGLDGAEVLCHWNAFDYRQGDLLAHRGVSRVYVFPAAIPDRSDWNVAHKIERFAAQLAPYSRTRYLFCPIGGDFVGPIPGLADLLECYNRLHYPKTGIWAVNAGLDDYLFLVGCYRDVLPAIEFDPNPYWMGFYTSRPTLKKKCHELVDHLLLAENLALLPGNESTRAAAMEALKKAWWYAAVSNHHDFITGTAPDRVVHLEQQPLVEKALTDVDNAIRSVMADKPVARRNATAKSGELPHWQSHDGIVEVHTPHYDIELADDKGGAVVRAWRDATQTHLLALSNDLICYLEWGGLWRMGHEFCGGKFKELGKSSEHPARLEVRENEGSLEVSCVSELGGETIRRQLWFRADSPVIRLRIMGRAAERCTVTARFSTSLSPRQLVMDQPGGVVTRPLQRIYKPTFWPLQHFVHIRDATHGNGIALFLAMPGAISCGPDGLLEIVALRNAVQERAFGMLPLLGLPASGREQSPYAFDYALLFTEAGDWRDNSIPVMARQVFDSELRELTASLVTTSQPDVFVTAVKPASRGEGIIVRLFTFTSFKRMVDVTIQNHPLKSAFLCDARERDIEPLEVQGQTVRLKMPGALATLRLLA
jgi:hypothetical protein